MQGVSGLVRTTRSWRNGQIVLIRLVVILSYRLSKYYVGGIQLNIGRSNSKYLSMLMSMRSVNLNSQ